MLRLPSVSESIKFGLGNTVSVPTGYVCRDERWDDCALPFILAVSIDILWALYLSPSYDGPYPGDCG